MNVWIVSLADVDSNVIDCVCDNDAKAKEMWKKLVDEKIKEFEEMMTCTYDEYEIKYHKIAINMYKNLTLDNIKDADYSYEIPIIKKYEVI